MAHRDDEIIQMSRAEFKSVIRETVEETFLRLGCDVSHPLEMQRDLQWVRDVRLASESVKRKGLLTIVTLVVTGIAASIWWGLKLKV